MTTGPTIVDLPSKPDELQAAIEQLKRGDVVNDDYAAFLAGKRVVDPETGLADVPPLSDQLFGFQRDITSWALRRGRAALFAGTGLGKSLMELAWADALHRETLSKTSSAPSCSTRRPRRWPAE